MLPLIGGYMWLYIHRPFEYWPALGTLQIERVYMLLMCVYWAAVAPKQWLPNRLNAALLAIGTVVVAAWLASPYFEQGSLAVESYLKVAVFFVLVVTSVRDEAGLRRLVLYYLIAANLYMVHSYFEFMNGRLEHRMGITRMVGVDNTYGEPNEFASSLLYTLPFAAALAASKPAMGLRLFLAGHTGLVALCILLTGSRAGFVSLLACVALVLLTGRQNRGLMLVLLATLGGAAVALPGPLQNRFLTILDASYGPANAMTSADSRLEGLLLGIQVWQESPIIGFGPSSFGYVTKRGLGAHNVYGQVLSETGVLGAAAFLGLLAAFLLNSLEARRRHRRSGARPDDFPYLVCRAIAINVLLLLLGGWAGHNLLRYNWQWFAALQIIALACLRARARQVPAPRPTPPWSPPPPTPAWRPAVA